jgi:hypothetical protein
MTPAGFPAVVSEVDPGVAVRAVYRAIDRADMVEAAFAHSGAAPCPRLA